MAEMKQKEFPTPPSTTTPAAGGPSSMSAPISSFVDVCPSSESTSAAVAAAAAAAEAAEPSGEEQVDIDSAVDGKDKGKGKGTGETGEGGVSSPGKGEAASAITGAYAAAVGSGSSGSGGGGGGGTERYNWMPSLCRSKPSRECIRRVRNDIRSAMRDPIPGLFVYPDEDLVTVVHALVTGPFDTPYEGGFFYFVLHCPDDYPHSPPRVRLMTTGGGTVRFNPNLYANGKVCLSILGTWNGPRWTPVHSISSVLLSIQSLMNEKPYHNEPGFEAASNPQDVRDYSDCITHETLRVAVCAMVDDSSLSNSMPACFQALTRDLFLSFVPRYELVCEQNMHRDGGKLVDPFGESRGTFRYASIARSIKRIASLLEPGAPAKADEVDSVAPPPGQDVSARPMQTDDAAAAAAAAAAAGSVAGEGEDGCGGSWTGVGASSAGSGGSSSGAGSVLRALR
ncbi:unnamed protein product [Ectocarpus sp. 4 AP-2014]